MVSELVRASDRMFVDSRDHFARIVHGPILAVWIVNNPSKTSIDVVYRTVTIPAS